MLFIKPECGGEPQGLIMESFKFFEAPCNGGSLNNSGRACRGPARLWTDKLDLSSATEMNSFPYERLARNKRLRIGLWVKGQ